MATQSIKRCFDYVRVSTDDQARKEYSSCTVQHDQCVRLIKAHADERWTLVQSFEDAGFSGSTTNRPGFQKLCHAVRSRQVDIVVVYNTDRISRDVADYLNFLELLAAHQVELISVTQNLQTKGAVGKFTNLMQAGIQQLESDRTAERTADVMKEHALNGLWNGGNAPMGYVNVKKRLEIDESEAVLVREIYAKAAAGIPLQEIADWLNESGCRTKVRQLRRRGEKDHQPIGGRKFRSDHLAAILRKPIYRGMIRWDGTEYQGLHTPLVTCDLWERANQAIAPAVSQIATRVRIRDRHHHLVKGSIYCGACGVSMTTHWTGKRGRDGKPYRYYECIRHARGESSHAQCAGRLPANQVERVMLSALNQIGTQPSLLNATLAAAKSCGKAEGPKLRREISQVQRELKDVAGQIATLIDTIKSSKMPGLEEDLQLEADNLGRKKLELVQRRAELTTRSARWRSMNPDPAAITKSLTNLAELIQRLSSSKRKELIQLLVERIEIRQVRGVTVRPALATREFTMRLFCRLPPNETDPFGAQCSPTPGCASSKEGNPWQISVGFQLMRDGKGYRASLAAPFDDKMSEPTAEALDTPTKAEHPIAQALRWQAWMNQNPGSKPADIARQFEVTRATVSLGLALTKLKPSIQEFLASLKSPDAIRLFSRRKLLPIAQKTEAEQNTAFGMLLLKWRASGGNL